MATYESETGQWAAHSVPRCGQSHADVRHHQRSRSSGELGRGHLSTANRYQCSGKITGDDDLEKRRKQLVAHNFCPLAWLRTRTRRRFMARACTVEAKGA